MSQHSNKVLGGGECYSSSVKVMFGEGRENGYVLVHGNVRSSIDGEEMGHSWLEKGEEIFDTNTNQHRL